ncbi:12116_t:CDS:2, partial [Cetraspora pellucida]
ETLVGIPSRSDIISECNNGLTAILQQSLFDKQPIYFMPNDVSDATEQKARIDITDIKPFFDIIMPDNEPLSIFKLRLVKIISGAKKIDKSKFGIKVTHTYPIHDYHTEKKTYIHIITWNHYDRTRILKEVHKHNIETASDDITNVYYYRKPLGDNKLDEQIVSSALIHDRTLVLIWDIETYSSHKMGDVPMAKYEEDQVFMICMTIHWRDDPKPLKQICFVDVETAPDPDWVTVMCGNQTNLLKVFALCWKAIMPDIQIGFNDSQYDWPFIIEKAKSLDILEWIYNYMSPEPSNIEEIIK